MPQRFLRPGITDSDRWNSVSFAAQSLFIRLLTRVDDYGRYDGRPSVICGQCFAVWNEKHPESAINPQESAALSCELMRVGLINIYESEGKKVLQITQWQERVRAGAKQKWPSAQNPLRNPAESCGFLPPSPPPSPSPAPSGEQPAATSTHQLIGLLLEELGSKLYQRSTGQPPSHPEEESALKIIKRPSWQDEKEILLAFGRTVKPEDRRFDLPKTLFKLLDDWDSALDKARNYKPYEKPSKHNSRNDGIANGPTDYGKAAEQKLARQALEARNIEASQTQGPGA